MGHELVVQDASPNPAALMRRSTDVASVCKAIVLKTALTISGRKYVKVEGWEAIASAHGCLASAQDVERVEPPDGGYRAIAVLRRIADGQELARAEGFVGDDEKTWAQRAVYARRAMAQTRAISRVCRAAFAHVVVLMDANLETTPAEEVPSDGFPTEVEEVRGEPDAPARTDEPVMGFGSCKGQSPSAMTTKDLQWYLKAYTENVSDPAKARYKRANLVILNALDAELTRRTSPDGGIEKQPGQETVPF